MKRLDSFTKWAVAVILANALGWVWCSYLLAYLGRFAIAETLSVAAVNTVLGTFTAYAVKSVIENCSKYRQSIPKNQKNPPTRRDY